MIDDIVDHVFKLFSKSLLPELELNRARYVEELKLLQIYCKSGNILDIGSGLGIVPLCLAKMNYNVTAVDKWEHVAVTLQGKESPKDVIDRLKRNGVKCYKINVLKQSLPFKANIFDCVALLAIIEHFNRSPKYMLSEANRVIKRGGILILSTPNHANLFNRFKFFFGRSVHPPIEYWWGDRKNFEGHYREYTLKEVCWMLEKSRFKILETRITSSMQKQNKMIYVLENLLPAKYRYWMEIVAKKK